VEASTVPMREATATFPSATGRHLPADGIVAFAMGSVRESRRGYRLPDTQNPARVVFAKAQAELRTLSWG
jgi:hypothetical protein